jgi:hypothetical protein
MRHCLSIAIILLMVCACRADAQRPALSPTGTVTGQVICDDTHRPARMASVTLIPIIAADPATAKSRSGTQSSVGTPTVQTLLDGSFTFKNIAPGSYYVIAEKVGYVSVTQIREQELTRLSKSQEEMLASLLSPVIVAANRITTFQTTLHKGAVIAGTVHFDDGSPDSTAAMSVMHRDKSGKWVPFVTDVVWADAGIYTDDQGGFRIPGLPRGEYLLKTALVVDGGVMRKDGGGTISAPPYLLDIYCGDGTRQRDAKAIKLNDGETSDFNNIEIPLARLHSVSGAVVSAETGATVNSARVELHFADDGSLVTATNTNFDAGEFHFPYVPEGEYTIKARLASDVVRGEYICPECASPPVGERMIRTYYDASQPIIIHSEMNGVTIQVKPQPPVVAAAR